MPWDEAARLRALAEYRILDTPREEAFENIVKLTAKMFGAPIALVTLVAEQRLWVKARHGHWLSETPREDSFCHHAVVSDATLMVPDARLDPRFAANPFVLGQPHIRFYCGVPLRTPERQVLGCLCIIDRRPRALVPDELSSLQALARQVELELEIRRRYGLLEEMLGAALEELKAKGMMAAMVVHDLRGPLAAITMLASSIEPADDESARGLRAVLAEAERLRRLLMDLLDVCLHEAGGFRLRRRVFSIVDVAADVARRARYLSSGRDGAVAVTAPEPSLLADADPEIVTRVLENLVCNAIQHAPDAPEVTIAIHPGAPGRLELEVADRGPVVAEADRACVFDVLTRGIKASHDRGRGLGLAFCRLAIEAHGGTIDLCPNGQGTGNVFRFDLPAANVGSASRPSAGTLAPGSSQN